MVVATDHVGDVHVVVVDHHRQHVGRRAVAPQQDHVVQVGIGHGDAALDQILDHRLALARRLEPDDRVDAGRRVGRIPVAPAAVVTHRPAVGARLLAHRLQFFGRGVAAVGVSGGQQLLGHLAMPVGPRELGHRLAVPVQTQPPQTLQDRVDGLLGGPFLVGIFDAQQEAAVAAARVQPVEQRRACPTDVQEAGG